jgi:hypothetical protein
LGPSDRYRAYGLAVRSRLALPCPRDYPGPADVVLTPASGSRFDSIARSGRARRRWFEYRELADGSIFLRWRGLSDFLISRDGRRIEYRRHPRTSPESLATYLLGQVLSFSLLARGVEPLHGTVVAMNGRAIGLVGDCGLGKSTLAAALLARGCPIVTDDLIVTGERGGGRVDVWPGIPRLKLYPRVARTLLGGSRAGTRMNRGSVKVVVALHGREAVRRRLPLHALYVLERSDDGVEIDRLRGAEALIEILRATFNDIVIRRARIASQFEFASRLVAAVPVYRLKYPRRLAQLPEVCEAIAAHVLT